MLLEEESNLVNDIQRLDSECQTLVYDHYDKFIAATDIVRQVNFFNKVYYRYKDAFNIFTKFYMNLF